MPLDWATNMIERTRRRISGTAEAATTQLELDENPNLGLEGSPLNSMPFTPTADARTVEEVRIRSLASLVTDFAGAAMQREIERWDQRSGANPVVPNSSTHVGALQARQLREMAAATFPSAEETEAIRRQAMMYPPLQYRTPIENRRRGPIEDGYRSMGDLSPSDLSFIPVNVPGISPSMGDYRYAIFGTNAVLDTASSATNAQVPARAVVEAPSPDMLKRLEIDLEALTLDDPRKKLAADAEALLGYTRLRKELRTPGTLRRVLAKLEIRVLEQESVDAYKAQMVAHYDTAAKMLMPTWRLTSLKEYQQPVPEFVLAKACDIKRELPEAEFYIDQLAVDPFLIVTLEPIPDYVTNQPTRALDAEKAAYVEVWSEPKFEATL